MIEQLDLQTFKCFENLRLPLRPLTLLSGTNASGKSSILQCLALLCQTMADDEWSSHLKLNGDLVRLGRLIDVVDRVYGQREFQIGLSDATFTCRWRFTGDPTDMSMLVGDVVVNDEAYVDERLRLLLPDSMPMSGFGDRLRGLTYISAERLPPQEIYRLEDPQFVSNVGPVGEHAVGSLYLNADESVMDELLMQGAPPTLLRQTQSRMRSFFPNCGLDVQPIQQANAVTLGLRNSVDTDFHRPVNVGFGLTQVLPIIVASLAATQDDLILVENPEVHLHPSGQAQIGGFVAEVAAAGVQVIAETHSDHVLNGVRRAVRDNVLNADDVAIHFFTPRQAGTAQVVTPTIEQDGNIDHWPDGFFDQYDRDMNYFAGWA